MRALSVLAACVVIAGAWSAVHAKTVEDYIAEATAQQRAGDAAKAYGVMEGALSEYPENATVYAFMGLYKGMQAGAATDMMQASTLSNESFVLLDRAVGFDSLNAYARVYRGLMGVKVPAFLGKLNRAIGDLETVLLIGERSPEAVSSDMLLMAYDLLGEGYGKKGDLQRAEAAWRKVIELAPGTDDARAAEEQIAGLPAGSQSEPQAPVATGHASAGAAAGTTATPAPQSADLAAMIEQAQASIAEGDYAAAQGILRAVIARDSTNAVAYRLLGAAIVYADRGYDKQIAEDTALRTNLVFESMSYLDKAVTLAPDDLEARLLRGIMGVQFPFFVGKLDQGIEDLEMVVASGAPEAMRNQARYHLGFGYQKKGMTYWTQIVNEGVDSSLVRLALQSMSPAVPHFDRSLYAGPIVMIEFVLAFRDELPPQTAVWVQDAQGNLVKTIYISGFSGNAKHVQIVLPAYAGDTEYADADAVTGASIDAGDHIYVWDLKDSAGKPVPSGEYTVKVEVSHWPSMKYQLATASLTVGGEQTSKVVSEGDYIPHLDVRYLPYEVK